MKSFNIIISLLFLTLLAIVVIWLIPNNNNSHNTVACTMDAMQCSDGSYVGRIPPRCEFAQCPLHKADFQEHTITYTNDGFDQKVISITRGDSVKFVNLSNRKFWPASDDHPSHMMYREFDVRRPLSPQEHFMFTFNRIGTWNYHDHMNASHVGQIIVNE